MPKQKRTKADKPAPTAVAAGRGGAPQTAKKAKKAAKVQRKAAQRAVQAMQGASVTATATAQTKEAAPEKAPTKDEAPEEAAPHDAMHVDAVHTAIKAAPPQFLCVVTDIEGTTSSISFVKEILFPYARNKCESFIAERMDSDEVLKPMLGAIRKQAKDDGFEENAKESSIWDAAKYARWIAGAIDADRKIGALKTFQGHIWKFAYEDGSVKGHVYKDVEPVLKKWQSKNIPVYIYSSGSIAAQKLLFGFSEKGDMLPYFAGHFDTTIGSKLETESYKKIAAEISKFPAEHILFLSDNVKEIDAALGAGFQTAILDRPGNAPLDPPAREGYYWFSPEGPKVPVIKNFEVIASRKTDFTNLSGKKLNKNERKKLASATGVTSVPKKRKADSETSPSKKVKVDNVSNSVKVKQPKGRSKNEQIGAKSVIPAVTDVKVADTAATDAVVVDLAPIAAVNVVSAVPIAGKSTPKSKKQKKAKGPTSTASVGADADSVVAAPIDAIPAIPVPVVTVVAIADAATIGNTTPKNKRQKKGKGAATTALAVAGPDVPASTKAAQVDIAPMSSAVADALPATESGAKGKALLSPQKVHKKVNGAAAASPAVAAPVVSEPVIASTAVNDGGKPSDTDLLKEEKPSSFPKRGNKQLSAKVASPGPKKMEAAEKSPKQIGNETKSAAVATPQSQKGVARKSAKKLTPKTTAIASSPVNSAKKVAKK
ncbi:HAD-like domain-containing protein [Chytriomyces sp. MP71]|nr:HAD-like domain-containing protein [Chytriomyces sp. MP71]